MLRDTAAARLSLGICPQQNVLFGSLSVMEHLQLYASIKGVPGAAACSCSELEPVLELDHENPSVKDAFCDYLPQN